MLMEAGGQPQKRSHLVKAATASASAWLQADKPTIGRLSKLSGMSQKKISCANPCWPKNAVLVKVFYLDFVRTAALDDIADALYGGRRVVADLNEVGVIGPG